MWKKDKNSLLLGSSDISCFFVLAMHGWHRHQVFPSLRILTPDDGNTSHLEALIGVPSSHFLWHVSWRKLALHLLMKREAALRWDLCTGRCQWWRDCWGLYCLCISIQHSISHCSKCCRLAISELCKAAISSCKINTIWDLCSFSTFIRWSTNWVSHWTKNSTVKFPA